MDVQVSVVIPTHNRAGSLAKAINSVCQQDFKAIEIIIVDDASTDNTQSVCSELAKEDPRIKIIHSNISQGGAAARNAGITLSRGKWIAFLDDDDLWQPNKISQQLSALAANPTAVACSCSYTVNYPLKKQKIVHTPIISFQDLLRANRLGGASVCIASTEVLKKMGGFDKHLRSSQDWDLWVRLHEQGPIITVGQSLVAYQVHFNYRISNNMRAKYQGARRFYFKYRARMNEEARLQNLAFLNFIQSRQTFRSRKHRLQKLWLAVRYSPKKVAMGYLMSSLPRMVR